MIDPLITLVISVSLALLFFMAARHKMSSLAEFEGQLAAYEILPAALVPTAARLLPIVEMAVVFLILIPMTRSFAAFLAVLLLSTYALAMAVNILRGRKDIDCGCGGQPQVLSVWLVVRNVVLVLGSSLLLTPGAQRSVAWSDMPFLILMTAVLAMVYLLVEQLVRNQSVMTHRSSSNG
ncbi:MAG: MauE/DoxX family redox-associated membrane protein [Gammaproteobacteria bacterium]|jgi:hypothetical protein